MANEENHIGVDGPELGADGLPKSTAQCVDEVLAEYGTPLPPAVSHDSGFEMTSGKSRALSLAAAGIIGGTTLAGGAAALSQSPDATPAHGPEVAALGVTPGSLVNATRGSAVLATADASPGCSDILIQKGVDNAGWIILIMILGISNFIAALRAGGSALRFGGNLLYGTAGAILRFPKRNEYQGQGLKLALRDPDEIIGGRGVTLSSNAGDTNADFAGQFDAVYNLLRAISTHSRFSRSETIGRGENAVNVSPEMESLVKAFYAYFRLQDIAANGGPVAGGPAAVAPPGGGMRAARGGAGRPAVLTPEQESRNLTQMLEDNLGEVVRTGLPIVNVSRDALNNGALNRHMDAVSRIFEGKGVTTENLAAVRRRFEKALFRANHYGTGNSHRDRRDQVDTREIIREGASRAALVLEPAAGADLSERIEYGIASALLGARRQAEGAVRRRLNPLQVAYHGTNSAMPRGSKRRLAGGVTAGVATAIVGTAKGVVPAYQWATTPSKGGEAAGQQTTGEKPAPADASRAASTAADNAKIDSRLTVTDDSAAIAKASLVFKKRYIEKMVELQAEGLTDEAKAALEGQLQFIVDKLKSLGVDPSTIEIPKPSTTGGSSADQSGADKPDAGSSSGSGGASDPFYESKGRIDHSHPANDPNNYE